MSRIALDETRRMCVNETEIGIDANWDEPD